MKSKSVNLSVRVRLTEQENEILNNLAKEKERSKTYFVSKAVKQFLNTQNQNQNEN